MLSDFLSKLVGLRDNRSLALLRELSRYGASRICLFQVYQLSQPITLDTNKIILNFHWLVTAIEPICAMDIVVDLNIDLMVKLFWHLVDACEYVFA